MVNPLTWFYRYLPPHRIYSTAHMLLALLCAVAGMVLILFSLRLIRKSGLGKIVNTTGRYFWLTQTGNAFVFILMAAPALFVGGFYLFVVSSVIDTLNGTYASSPKELVTAAYKIYGSSILLTIIIVWIIYILLGALLKPFIWTFNGIVSLFPTQISLKTDTQPALAETYPSTDNDNQQSLAGKIQDYLLLIEDYLLLKENSRFFKAIGFIIVIPLVFVIGFWIFSKPTPPTQVQAIPPVSPSLTPDWFQPLHTPPPTYTPVSAQGTNPFIAMSTKTVAAAFTQLAAFAQATLNTATPTPTSTSTATVTPITTLTPTGDILLLDNYQTCREGPGNEFPEVTSLASE